MKNITPHISPLIASQFPSFYQEEGPQFIALVKSYYEWLEQSNNVLYHSRKLLEYHDIDETVEDFIVYFKEQTLKNIQFDTASNKRLFVKNALDFYRSKGTQRSIDLFFKLVYAQPAKVYYPGDDLFKLSDNTWKVPQYLEVSESIYNPDFEGKQITGLTSGATAFVENYAIKKKVNNQFDSNGDPVKISKNIYIFFITNRRGNFQYGEQLVHTGTTDPRGTPSVIGSLNELQVITGASDYVVGDVVTLISNTGFNGKALVTSVINTTGQVDFTLIDGGWGYTTSPKIIISEKALVINNVSSSIGNTKPFKLFNSLIQPKAYIEFDTLVGTLSANSLLYSYNSGDVTSISRIINIQSSSTTGNMNLSVISGSLPDINNTLYVSGNASSANITVKIDKTSTANIMGVSTNNVLLLTNISSGRLPIVGEEVYQSNDSHGEWVNAIVQEVKQEAGQTLVTVTGTEGSFLSSFNLKGKSSNSNSTISSYSTTIGIYDTSETSIASVQVTNMGSGYSNGQLVTFQSDDGEGYGAVGLIVTYPANGSVSAINLLNPGSGYITAPTVKVVNTATPKFFNAFTDVNETTDFISIPNSGFINAQFIRYNVTESNTALIGLVPNFTYYARLANNSGIQLSATPAGNVISLTKGLNQNGHSFTAVVSSGNNFAGNTKLGSLFDYRNKLYVYNISSNQYSFNPATDVSTSTDFITLNNHSFANGQAIVYEVKAGRTRLNSLCNNVVYYVTVANSSGIKLAKTLSDSQAETVINLTAGSNENGHSFAAYSSGILDLAGEGSLADLRISSLDDEETYRLNTDFINGYNIYGAPYLNMKIDASSNSALSGSNSYGFPASPFSNLTYGSINSILAKEMFTIGTITNLGLVNPGEDYTLDPFITVIEPVIAGYNKHDVIITIDGDTARLANKENILISSKKLFDGSSSNVISSFIYMNRHPFIDDEPIVYTTQTGSSVIGGLANGLTYYITSSNSSGFALKISLSATDSVVLTPTGSTSYHYIQNGNYEKFGVIQEIINNNSFKVKRLNLFKVIDDAASIYLQGETSAYNALVLNIEDDQSISGLNSIIEANTIIANGYVKTLKVIDSGFAYEPADIMSFQRENDSESTIGLAKGSNIKQGEGSGFYQNTKGFLSRDKYLHDNDFYQDYSYQIISRIPFERYKNMLKKVLHVAGTKMFPGVEIESKNSSTIQVANSTIVIE